MGESRTKYDVDFKKNAVKLSCASPKTVKEIADDLGIHENLLYNWRRKYTADGDKTKYATLDDENKDLRTLDMYVHPSSEGKEDIVNLLNVYNKEDED